MIYDIFKREWLRFCKVCAELLPITDYQYRNARAKTGYSLGFTCVRCRQRKDRELNRERLRTPEYREGRRLYRERRAAAGNPVKTNVLSISQRQWAWRLCEFWLSDRWFEVVTIYLVEGTEVRKDLPVTPDRPWIGKTWALRAKAGKAPAFAIPLAVVENGLARPHWSTPDNWRWVARHINRWLLKQREDVKEIVR